MKRTILFSILAMAGAGVINAAAERVECRTIADN